MEWLPSMSAFHGLPNDVWYFAMHITIIYGFLIDSVKNNKFPPLLVSSFTVGISAFSMYTHPVTHNVMTALMFITVCYYIIKDAPLKFERTLAIFHSGLAGLLFLLGLFVNVHLFLAEALIMFIVAVMMCRRIWIYNL